MLVSQATARNVGAVVDVPEHAAIPPRGVVGSLIECTKPGITRLVTATSMVGFVLAASMREWSLVPLIVVVVACAAGTALSASGANAINQYMERRRDALMRRTRNRPIPQGRVSPLAVLATGLGLSVVGVAVLWLLTGAAPAAVSAACVLVYVGAYTPLKPVSVLSTLVGTIPGALPPLIGWAAASDGQWASLLEPGGLSLFALMTAWQMPHFMAIAWMYKDDYALGGYKVLPVMDPTGRRTSSAIALWTSALVPASLLPAIVVPERLGMAYIIVALGTGLIFAWMAARLLRSRERADARRLFFGSIIHLPALLAAIVGESLIRAWI